MRRQEANCGSTYNRIQQFLRPYCHRNQPRQACRFDYRAHMRPSQKWSMLLADPPAVLLAEELWWPFHRNYRSMRTRCRPHFDTGSRRDDPLVERDNQGETAASIRMRMRWGWTDGARA